VLFLMARECMGDCTKPGRLVAVQRIEKLKLPVTYSMGPEHVMMAGTPFSGPFLVQARIDRDGDAMTKGPDDLYAEVTTGVTPGQANVVLAVGKLATPPAPRARPLRGSLKMRSCRGSAAETSRSSRAPAHHGMTMPPRVRANLARSSALALRTSF
jgi:hypothetical protein